jgi:hypothetical protein
MGSNGDKGWAGLGEALLDKFGYGKRAKRGEGECVYMSAVWKGGAIGEACEQQQEEIRGEVEEKGDEVASTKKREVRRGLGAIILRVWW